MQDSILWPNLYLTSSEKLEILLAMDETDVLEFSWIVSVALNKRSPRWVNATDQELRRGFNRCLQALGYAPDVFLKLIEAA